MFVYKRDTLEKTIEYISDNRARVGIYHKPTKMALSFVVYTDERMPKLEPNVYSSKSFSDAPLSSLVSAYEIRGMEKDSDKYSFVKDVYSPRKTLVENFLEAIEVFENEIFERLNEQKPQATPPETPPQPKVERKSELPKVGDIVREGAKYGRVIDVNADTREIKISQMSKDSAMSILKNIRQGLMEEASPLSGQPNEENEPNRKGMSEWMKQRIKDVRPDIEI